MSSMLEEGSDFQLDFTKLDQISGCVPVAIQSVDTREVILLAYTNEYAMKEAFRTKRLILWSTSRQQLWEKGATSGCRFELVEAYVNCEQNSLVYLVKPSSESVATGICHTHNSQGNPRNCFYRRIDFETQVLVNVDP